MKIRKGRAALLVPFLAVFFALILAGTGGCASGGGSPAPTSTAGQAATGGPAPGSAATITIKDFGYGAAITVSPGTTVTVTNLDSARHTVTADEGSAFDVDVQGGGTGTFAAPMRPGNYAFHCTFHPGMHGTLTVK